MKFHNITESDMLNGDDIGTVLWVSGCEIGCKGCQNKNTWDPEVGIEFDEKAKSELFEHLSKDYNHRFTLSGGHPLHPKNVNDVLDLVKEVSKVYPDTEIWLYTGHTINFILMNMINTDIEIYKNMVDILKYVDVVVDGPFIEALKDINYKWAGSTNQRVINMPDTFINVTKRLEDIKSDVQRQNEIIDECIVLHK